VSNSVNFYEFIGFVTFNIAVHELIFVYIAFFLIVFLCLWYRQPLCVH